MHSRLSLEFSQDTLYKNALKHKKMALMLVDRYMEELDQLKTYSSTTFEEWYCNQESPEHFLINDSSMRRWLGNFNEYIEAERAGRNWELDYRAMFRLRMLLVYRKFGYKPSKLQEILGLKATVQLLEDEEKVPVETQPAAEDSLRFFASVGMQLMQSGLISLDDERRPILQIPALPGNLEKRLEEIDSNLQINASQIEQLQDALTEQKKLTVMQQETIENQLRLTEKQQHALEAVSNIHEMIIAYQQHGDPEKLQTELHELRKKDPETYIDTMMNLIKSGKKKKRGLLDIILRRK